VASTDLKNDVQAWVNSTAINQGWFIKATGTTVNVYPYSNQYATDTTKRPKLTITYH
jgi:hypothetical protein